MMKYIFNNEAKLSMLLGTTLKAVEVIKDQDLLFTLDNGKQYVLTHCQECCEDVYIEDIVGDLDDLVGSPILLAEEVVHTQVNPDGVVVPEYQDSFTWTFYKFATAKGYVDVRWYGTSNGYYSESVDFMEIDNEETH
jgi:hypothetical protein